jgi:hypothetical protein
MRQLRAIRVMIDAAVVCEDEKEGAMRILQHICDCLADRNYVPDENIVDYQAQYVGINWDTEKGFHA